MIWQRLYLKETVKAFLLLLVSLFFLYALIDFAFNAHLLLKASSTTLQTVQFYFWKFSKRAPLISSFCLMLASLKVLMQSRQRLEIVALLSCGVSKRSILRPFCLLGALLCLLLYANEEYIKPQVLPKLLQMESAIKKSDYRQQVKNCLLEDGSCLVYKEYIQDDKCFYDVFWMQSLSQVWHFTKLEMGPTARAQEADFLQKGPDGWLRQFHYTEKYFPQMPQPSNHLLQNPSLLPLSQLLLLCKDKNAGSFYATFLSRAIYPLFALLCLLPTLPLCLSFHRQAKSFFLYAASIAGFLLAQTCFNALSIIAENSALPAHLALAAPFVALLLFSSLFFFCKTR